MRKKDLEPVTLENVAEKYGLPHIGDDIVLMDNLKALSPVVDAKRMSLCLFIGVCTSGFVTLSVNERKRSACGNNVMIITDESVISDLRWSEDFEGFGFFISYKLLQNILSDVKSMSDLFLLTHNYPVFELKKEELQEVQQYFTSIMRRIEQTDHHYRLEVVRLMILTMIYDMSEAFDRVLHDTPRDERQTRGEHLFVEFIQTVKQHFREQRQVQWYAKQMGITPKYLCEVISGASRRSPNEWIDKFVTSEMRNLLRHTDKKMSQIAKELNFSTQSFFGKYFKDNVGISPTEYRNGIEPTK